MLNFIGYFTMYRLKTKIWKAENFYYNYICPKFVLSINFSSKFHAEYYTQFIQKL